LKRSPLFYDRRVKFFHPAVLPCGAGSQTAENIREPPASDNEVYFFAESMWSNYRQQRGYRRRTGVAPVSIIKNGFTFKWVGWSMKTHHSKPEIQS
jgi:hypothetical protein